MHSSEGLPVKYTSISSGGDALPFSYITAEYVALQSKCHDLEIMTRFVNAFTRETYRACLLEILFVP